MNEKKTQDLEVTVSSSAQQTTQRKHDPPRTYLPDTDEVVTVSSKEGLAISTPGKGQALGWVGPGGSRHLKKAD